MPSHSCIITPLGCVIIIFFFLITIKVQRILYHWVWTLMLLSWGSCVNMWSQYVSPVWPLYFLFLPDFVLAVVSCYICCKLFSIPLLLARNVTIMKFVYFSPFLTSCIIFLYVIQAVHILLSTVSNDKLTDILFCFANFKYTTS